MLAGHGKTRGLPGFVLLALAMALAGCPAADNQPAGDLAGRTVRVATTTGMIADIARNVGGERVAVTALMGPGVDPHYYRATPGNVQTLQQADIVFYNGLELEGRMTEIFENIARGGKPTVPVTRDVPRDQLRQPKEFEGRYDPHVWFDVPLWKRAVESVRDELARLDPSSAELYRQNAAAYLKRLDELHRYVQTEITKIPKPQRVLVTAHDAFGYFGRRYGMEVRGLQGTSTATETGARDVQDLARFIAEGKIKAIFVESSVPKNTIEAVQQAVRARGWDVAIGGQLFSDAMGQEGTPEGTYVGMVRHNVDTMVKALT